MNTRKNFNKRIAKHYDWFTTEFSTAVKNASDDFWENDISYKLISISDSNNILFTKDVYFVSKIKINKDQSVCLRLSKEAVRIFLENTLGINGKTFDLTDLSEVEQKIILAFNDFLYKRIQKNLLLPESKEEKHKLSNEGECHLTFLFQDSKSNTGKIIISIPLVVIQSKELATEQAGFDMEDFKRSKTEVHIKVGTTKLSLKDVKQLEKEDIIVLENSSTQKMELKFDEYVFAFRLNPDPALILETESQGGDDMAHNIDESKDVWDTIQVEISAEFEKVKISLGELKQISQGLVVDIGSVFENKVDLKVENKIIANGELVIINDRYGIKINEIYKEAKKTASEEAKTQPQQQAEPEPAQVADDKEESFDYSDFELEDENI